MFETVARDFVKMRFKGMDGVLGVLLVGSASLGYTDDISDIDLEVVATQDLFHGVGGKCGSALHQGITVFWEWSTLEELRNALKDWRDDVDLWVYSRSRPLYDPQGRIGKLLGSYRKYPKEIWLEKLFTYWYFATGSAPYDSGRAIQRVDLLTAQLYLSQAIEYYTALIFVLNKSFVPHRKWRLKEMRKLSYKPENYEESLRKILEVKAWSKEEFELKQNVINGLVGELEQRLTEIGLSKDRLENPWKFKVTYVPRV